MDAVWRDRHIGHANLVTGEEKRSSLQRHHQHRENAHLSFADAARHPLLVVSADHPIRPAIGRYGVEVGIDRRLHGDRGPVGVEQREVERQMQARLSLAVEVPKPVGFALYFAGQHPFRKFVDD